MRGSLPSWERGLKSSSTSDCLLPSASLPSWERGLKSKIVTAIVDVIEGRSLRGSVD